MKNLMMMIVVIFLFGTFLNAALPTVVPNDKGGYDYIFYNGPAGEEPDPDTGKTKTTCPGHDDTRHCHTVSSSVEMQGGFIPKGTEVNIFVYRDDLIGDIGYLKAIVVEDYDGTGDFKYDVNSAQVVYDYNTWNNIREF